MLNVSLLFDLIFCCVTSWYIIIIILINFAPFAASHFMLWLLFLLFTIAIFFVFLILVYWVFLVFFFLILMFSSLFLSLPPPNVKYV